MSKAPIILLIVVAAALIAAPIGCSAAIGIDGFGPTRTFTTKIVSKHVYAHEHGTSYMVTTDAGTFEVENGFLLGLWNADELYGGLGVSETYRITTKGNKFVGVFFQEYPYVIRAEKVNP